MFKFLRKKHQNVIKMEFPKKPEEEEEDKETQPSDIKLICNFMNDNPHFYNKPCCSDMKVKISNDNGITWSRCLSCGKMEIWDTNTVLRLAKEALTNKNVQNSSNVYRFKEK